MSNFVLVVGPPHSGKVRIAQLLSHDVDTGALAHDSHSGLTYTFTLSTKYFQSAVTLLVEEYPDTRTAAADPLVSLQRLCADLGTAQYAELRAVLAGVVFTVAPAQNAAATARVYSQIKALFAEHDMFFVVVAVAAASKHTLEQWEDAVCEHGMEFVDFAQDGTNEYRDTLGKARLREIFECHEWAHTLEAAEPEPAPKHMDLDALLQKLELDKRHAQSLPEAERTSFVDDLVDHYMEYF